MNTLDVERGTEGPSSEIALSEWLTARNLAPPEVQPRVPKAIADGTWGRLKAWREHSREWAFYDHTKNRSGAWCNMQVCGNRAKARAYRERRAGATAPD